MNAGNMLDLDAAFGSLNQPESSSGGSNRGNSDMHAGMEHRPRAPPSHAPPMHTGHPPPQHSQQQHMQHQQPQHMQHQPQHMQQHMQHQQPQHMQHQPQHMQQHMQNQQQHMNPPTHTQARTMQTGDAHYTPLPPQHPQQQPSPEEMQRRQALMQQRAAMQHQQHMQQQMQMQKMQQQQQQQAEQAPQQELRSAAGGFARFAKRLNTDSSSGIFMIVSIVLVFILIGALVMFACKSAAPQEAIVPPAAPQQYPF